MESLKKFWNNLMSNPIAKKTTYIMGIFILLIIFILIIASCSAKKTYTYKELENKMVELAKKKYTEDALPKNGASTTIKLQQFVDDGSLKNISDIIENNSVCTGHVTIVNNNDNYLYLPYLNCANDYKTLTLYEALTENVTTKGNGLYKINDEYIFKGEIVNNYLVLNGIKFRIIKVNEDGTIKAVDTTKRSNVVWDDHYNIEKNSNVGLNDYIYNDINSRIKDTLDEYYNNEEYYTSDTKAYFKTHDLCIGKRSVNEFNNDGSIECANVLENQVFGLLQVSDFFNASLDQNCTSMESQSCSNYNYFSTMSSTWSITTDKDTTYKAYKITTDGVYLSKASSSAQAKVAVLLDKDIVVTDGDGSEDNPYIVGYSASK